MNVRSVPEYLRYWNWYVKSSKPIPLCSDLDAVLPLPDLKRAKVLWPRRYAWAPGKRRLDPIKREFFRLLRVELYDQAAEWHKNGGFPVPARCYPSLGRPRNPKGSNDLRGEIFELHFGKTVVCCAFDYSDYPVVSEDILGLVDVYFKVALAPDVLVSQKVVSAGFYARTPRLLAIARSHALKRSHARRRFDVYGRFGSWTDSQAFRHMLVERFRNGPLNFTGGFETLIYPAYLEELMETKIALDVPGQAAVSYRLVEAMALGALVVCVKPAFVFPEQMIDGFHYVSFKADGSDVIEVCRELLADRERRERITQEAMRFFDRNFSPQSIARRVIRHAAEVAGIARAEGKQ